MSKKLWFVFQSLFECTSFKLASMTKIELDLISDVEMYLFFDKPRLLFADTDRLMYEIETENDYDHFNRNKEMFDFSNYSIKSNITMIQTHWLLVK